MNTHAITRSGAALLMGALVLSMAAPQALGQAREEARAGNPELGPDIDPPQSKDRLKLSFSMRSEGHAYENLDLLPLDESTDLDVILTDDRHTFAYSSINARAEYAVDRDLDVYVQIGHNGLWSEDQLGSQAELVGVLNFRELSFRYTPVRNKQFRLAFQVGRQPFRIGGVPRDFMLDDVLDAVTVTADARKFGRLRILALDFYSGNDQPDAAFVRYVSGRETVLGLRGDTFTVRTGAIYENIDKLLDGLVFKLYYFYADIGGGPIAETGADLSYGGTLGNFSDNDWNAMYGGRVSYTLRQKSAAGTPDDDSDDYEKLAVRIYGEAAGSDGIDRKEVVARDVDINGMAYGGGVEARAALNPDARFALRGGFYHFDGAEYASDGLRFESGFVGFKGRYIGGLNMSRYAGWRPSAFLNSGGVQHRPNAVVRSGGTEFLHVGASAQFFRRAKLNVDWWTFTDTNNSFVDFANLDALNPPFGYAREEFAAQERYGRDLGQELDVTLEYRFTRALTGFATYGLFTPGDYYNIEISRIAETRDDTSLGSATGTADFWAATAGAEVRF